MKVLNTYSISIIIISVIITFAVLERKKLHYPKIVNNDFQITLNPPRFSENLVAFIKNSKESLQGKLKFSFSVKEKVTESLPSIKNTKILYPETYEIKFSIQNLSKDTICYLTQSCFGEYDQIIYDEKILSRHNILCAYSNPEKIVIPPRKSTSFILDYYAKSIILQNTLIKFGFEFTPIPNDFDINLIYLGGTPINQISESDKLVLWASSEFKK